MDLSRTALYLLFAVKMPWVQKLKRQNKFDEAMNILKSLRAKNQSQSEHLDTSSKFIDRLIEKQLAVISIAKAEKLCEEGRYLEASSAFVEAFGASGNCLDREHYLLKVEAAICLSRMGEHPKSYKMLNEIVQSSTKLFGSTDPYTLCAQSMLAREFSILGEQEESLLLFEDALGKMKIKLGVHHPLTLDIQLEVATGLLNTGATQRALELSEDVFETRKKILGTIELETLEAQNIMAKSLYVLDKETEAFDMFTDVFNGKKKKLGSSHPDTLRLQSIIGFLLIKRAHYLEALQLLTQVLEKQDSILGNAHPHTKFTADRIEDLERLVGPKKFAELLSSCLTGDDFTELMDLIEAGNERGVDELLRRGIDISLVLAGIGSTPLHIAVNNNSIDIVRCLLKHADRHLLANEKFDFINARTTFASGNTAMHIAASNGSLEAVKVLLEYGAAYNIRNKQGKTPRDLTEDQHTKYFLSLVDVIFNGVREGDFIVINKLQRDEIFIVMNATDEGGYSLRQIWMEYSDKSLAGKFTELIGRIYCSIL